MIVSTTRRTRKIGLTSKFIRSNRRDFILQFSRIYVVDCTLPVVRSSLYRVSCYFYISNFLFIYLFFGSILNSTYKQSCRFLPRDAHFRLPAFEDVLKIGKLYCFVPWRCSCTLRRLHANVVVRVAYLLLLLSLESFPLLCCCVAFCQADSSFTTFDFYNFLFTVPAVCLLWPEFLPRFPYLLYLKFLIPWKLEFSSY